MPPWITRNSSLYRSYSFKQMAMSTSPTFLATFLKIATEKSISLITIQIGCVRPLTRSLILFTLFLTSAILLQKLSIFLNLCFELLAVTQPPTSRVVRPVASNPKWWKRWMCISTSSKLLHSVSCTSLVLSACHICLGTSMLLPNPHRPPLLLPCGS